MIVVVVWVLPILLVDRLVGRSFGWSVVQSIVRSAGRLFGWLVGRLFGWLVGRSVVWLVDRSVGRSVRWLLLLLFNVI